MTSADEFFGPPPKPTADEFFPQSPSGPHTDSLLAGSAVGRVLSAFGQGVEDGWGSEPLGLSPDAEKSLRDVGLNPDKIRGPIDLINKGFHDAFIRPAAIGLDAAMRAGGSLFGAYQSTAAQVGEEVGASQLGRDIAAMPEAFFGSPGNLRLPKVLTDARETNVIGPGGEAAFKGAKVEEPKPGIAKLDSLKNPDDVNAIVKEIADKKQVTADDAGLKWNGRSYVAVKETKSQEDYIQDAINRLSQTRPSLTQRADLSAGELRDLADETGMSPGAINSKAVASRFTPEELDAAKDLLEASANTLRERMGKVAPGDAESIDAYIRSQKVHQLLLDHVLGREAEPIEERLNAEGKPIEVAGAAKEAQDKKAVEVAQAGAGIEDPRAINRYVEDTKKPGAIDMLIEMRNNGLISGPATHGDYGLGNYLFALTRAVPEGAMSGAFGTARRVITGAESGVRPSEVQGQMYGFFAGHREAWAAAKAGWKTGQNTPLPHELPTPLWTYPEAIPGKVGDLIRYPKKGVAFIHSFFRTVGYRQHLNGIAYRTATEENLQGQAFRDRLLNVNQNPTEAQIAEATIEATKQTLMGRGGKWTNAMAELASGNKFLRFVIPFVRIQGNIARQKFLERTPLGFFDEEIRDNLLGKNGEVAQDRQAGAMLWGSAVAATVGTLAASDLVTGYGPTDPNERRVWLNDHQPYSANIGGHWISFQHLGVVGGLTGLMADGYGVLHEMSKPQGDKWVGHLMGGIMRGLLSEGWMRDFSDLFNAFEDALSGKGQVAERYINNFFTSFVPFSSFLNQTNQAFLDPDLREARSLLDTFESKLPFLSQNLLPRRDVWGEPIERHSVTAPLPLSAMWTRSAAADPLDTALRKAGWFPASPPRTVRGMQLTDQQYDDLSRVSGRLMRVTLERVVSQPGFERLPTSVQVEILRSYSQGARQMAEAQTLMTNPEFLRAAVEKERARLK